jgi:hypothetical protein
MKNIPFTIACRNCLTMACWLVALSPLVVGQDRGAGQTLPLMELRVGRTAERGIPISWRESGVILLRTDGSLREFEPQQIASHHLLTQEFRPETAFRLRGLLQQEFGRGYRVDGSSDFTIVAPPSTVGYWSDRFALLQRSFDHYFRTRGYPLKPLDFPLVGIVFASQAEFLQHAEQIGLRLQAGTVGYYSPATNRLYAYQSSDTPAEHSEALATVWHEAAHQLAFNRGLHQRLTKPPLWLLEGLASIFEAPGMMGSRASLQPSALINRSRWDDWQALARQPEKRGEIFEQLVVDDRYFRLQPEVAYSLSWGISLYLAERETAKYMKYLQRLSQLPLDQEYAPGQRLQDFRQAFPGNPRLLLQAADRFLEGL